MVRRRLGCRICPKLSSNVQTLSEAERFDWEVFQQSVVRTHLEDHRDVDRVLRLVVVQRGGEVLRRGEADHVGGTLRRASAEDELQPRVLSDGSDMVQIWFR